MAERDTTLAHVFQQLEARLEAALAAQRSLDVEREVAQRTLGLAQERQQTQEPGRGY